MAAAADEDTEDMLEGALRPGGGCCIFNCGGGRLGPRGVRSGWPDAVGEGTASKGLRSLRGLGVSWSDLSMAVEEMASGATPLNL